jgi:hypothetical protein
LISKFMTAGSAMWTFSSVVITYCCLCTKRELSTIQRALRIVKVTIRITRSLPRAHIPTDIWGSCWVTDFWFFLFTTNDLWIVDDFPLTTKPLEGSRLARKAHFIGCTMPGRGCA